MVYFIPVIPNHKIAHEIDYFNPILWKRCFVKCVVPENIQTPTTEGIGNSEGVGGSMAQEIPKGRGVSRPNSLPDGREND